MDFLTIITGLLSKAYKLDQGEIDALLQGDDTITEEQVITRLLERDANRVTALKKASDMTGKFQEGYAKAKKEERAAFERELKEKWEIDSELTGIDLIQHILEVKAPEAGKGKTALTDDDVKKHQAYQALEAKYKKDLKAKDDDYTAKIEEINNKRSKEETFNTVKAKALTLLEGLNPILPGTPEVASNQKNWFISALQGMDYEIQGDRVVVMKDGKVVEDEHGNSVDFDSFVKSSAAKVFEFKKSNGGQNPKPGGEGGQGGQGGDGAYPAGITKPKTFEEFAGIMNNQSLSPADKQVVSETWERENPNG